MSALILLTALLLASAGRCDSRVDSAPIASPSQVDQDSPWGHRTGEGATVNFSGGTVEIGFMPIAGSTRAVLRLRCGAADCPEDLRDPLLLVPIANVPRLRVRLRSVGSQLVSTTPLSRLPHGSTLTFSLSGRRHDVRMR